jgi:hypothetical protein
MMKIMTDMRKYMMIIMAVALMALPTMAQEQEQWKSTSIMSGAGGYTAPITEVGSASVGEMATTTGSAAKAPSAPRRGFIDPSNPGPQSDADPIGDAVLPLALMALTFAGVVYFRKRKARV